MDAPTLASADDHLNRVCDLYMRCSRAYVEVRHAHMAARRDACVGNSISRDSAADLQSLALAEALACEMVTQCSVAIADALSATGNAAINGTSEPSVRTGAKSARIGIGLPAEVIEFTGTGHAWPRIELGDVFMKRPNVAMRHSEIYRGIKLTCIVRLCGALTTWVCEIENMQPMTGVGDSKGKSLLPSTCLVEAIRVGRRAVDLMANQPIETQAGSICTKRTMAPSQVSRRGIGDRQLG